MRYYDIKITDPKTGKLFREYTSLVPGTTAQPNPSALNVELDITIADYTAPSGAFLTIWGVTIKDIQAALQFNNLNITIIGGMTKGLPLASPSQQGILVQGVINQCYGNWQGTEMNIQFVILGYVTPSSTTTQATQTANIVLNWIKGQTLAQALQNTLASAFPLYLLDIQIDERLVLGYNEQFVAQTISQLSIYCNSHSKTIINTKSYLGVSITNQNGTLIVRDGSTMTAAKTINFNDLIGQITLDNAAAISVTCVLRGDIRAYDYINIPPGQLITSANSYPQYRMGNLFTGVFLVTQIRHVGNFRQKAAESWVTVLTATGPFDAKDAQQAKV